MPGGIRPTPEILLSWPQRSDHPERRGLVLTVTTIVLFLITLVVVLARLWARLFLQRNGGLDDIFIALTMVRYLV